MSILPIKTDFSGIRRPKEVDFVKFEANSIAQPTQTQVGNLYVVGVGNTLNASNTTGQLTLGTAFSQAITSNLLVRITGTETAGDGSITDYADPTIYRIEANTPAPSTNVFTLLTRLGDPVVTVEGALGGLTLQFLTFTTNSTNFAGVISTGSIIADARLYRSDGSTIPNNIYEISAVDQEDNKYVICNLDYTEGSAQNAQIIPDAQLSKPLAADCYIRVRATEPFLTAVVFNDPYVSLVVYKEVSPFLN